MLIVCAEIGLRDLLYAIIKLDTTYFGYNLPMPQIDTNMPGISMNQMLLPRIPRNDRECEPDNNRDVYFGNFDGATVAPLHDISDFHRNFWGSFNSSFERNFGQRASRIGRHVRSRAAPLPIPNFDASDLQARTNTSTFDGGESMA